MNAVDGFRIGWCGRIVPATRCAVRLPKTRSPRVDGHLPKDRRADRGIAKITDPMVVR